MIGVAKTARRIAASCLLLFFLAGNALAQNDSPFVIKKGDNYLAHVKEGGNYVVRNAVSFNPATCLWYSGPDHNPTGYTHNYYFEDDEGELRFLAAPLQPNATLSLSNSLPSVSMLRNTDQIYYFYNWDPEIHLNGIPEGGGVAKGHRYYVDNSEQCTACGGNWAQQTNGTFQCWKVYWIENVGTNWKLSSVSQYNITANGARYRKVTITEHEKNVTAGGLTTLTVPREMNFEGNSELSASVESPYSYIPAYTNYVFLESSSTSVHNYWDGEDHSAAIPLQQNDVDIVSESISYQWTISGDGAEYLSFVNSSSNPETTSTLSSPILYYVIENNTGHKTATITVTVTYTDEVGKQTTQTRSATVLVKTPCQNPIQAAPPVITYVGVTVSWVATADSYTVYWKKDDSSAEWSSATVNGATSYTITGLEYNTRYVYKVTTDCGTNIPTEYRFTTKEEPGLMVVGAIFGGGRMANVGGKTEVVIVNCDSIGGIYGGNDIAGEVEGADGSTIMLGVNSGDPTYGSYGTTGDTIRFGSVYGGGNGYYAYNGTSFVAATSNYTSEYVADGASVMAMTPEHTVGDAVWTNTSGASKTLEFPKIVKTAITVSNDFVKADSIFGGAKNAFLTAATGNGSTITIDGGTIMAVFGGNNFGGGQGYGKHYIEVNQTKTKLALDIHNTDTKGYGRNFGIRYLFGGGNKVYGSTTDIRINGGQIDNVFGGGNAADVYDANVTVNCSLGAYSSEHPYTFGNTYTNAIPTTYSSGDISIKDDYAWDGKGIYNVRNLYGGNNLQAMEGVPTVTLTSGSVGTVYGGGNAGDMLAYEDDGGIDEDGNGSNDFTFNYGTYVELSHADMIVDYIYGGCRMSNVDYSTWVKIVDGHVGTVFGGCNVSGDVGSTCVNPNAAPGTEAYQVVQGGTYVETSGGTIYKNLFAGGNGFYHCNANFHYSGTIFYTDENYLGRIIPTHNETHAFVKTGAIVKGNVYAGGNLAPVGFLDIVAPTFPSFPTNAVGWALVHIYGGTVMGNVYGGGNMADIYGNNDVLVAGGSVTALYGGNDRTGQVAEYSNRVLPLNYQYATDGHTSLVNPEVHAYVRVTGSPTIQEVYGGGNGDYDYENGDEIVPEYCNDHESGPIQSNTFVDININGGVSGGHIGTVYGGGDGVTASGFITVLLNVNNPDYNHDNVDVVFGGNNKGDLALVEKVPDIILLHGQVGTVYGGCNEGAMNGSAIIRSTDNANTYSNVGSLVRLRRRYITADDIAYPTAKVSKAIYGGCRMNGVAHNSLVLVEGGNFYNAPIFGGSDISGTVGEWSKVVVRDDAAAGSGNGVAPIVGNLYGGGNGDYVYESASNSYGDYLIVKDVSTGLVVADSVSSAPICANSGVTILSGQVGYVEGNIVHEANVYGGGYGQMTETTGNVIDTIGLANAASAAATPTLYGDVYGGSALGKVNTATTSSDVYWTTVNFFNGTIHGNVYGGGLGYAEVINGYLNPTPTNDPIPAVVKGNVQVNVGSNTADAEHPDVSKFVNIDGSVFGGNNLAGSPEGKIFVDVYRTAHTEGNTYPSTFPAPIPNSFFEGDLYALPEVYGGGNLAKYTGEKTNVHVHNCDNTIEYVYGGGNAADVPESEVTIDGGLVKYVFGGGNGYGTGNPGANIGYYEGETLTGGDNTLALNGGVMGYVFGGSNTRGMVYGVTDLQFQSEPNCNVRSINELYGGGNQAEDTNGITLNVPCGTSGVNTVYGGSKLAPITGDVVLSVKGGTFDYVYGGSKGEEGNPANIDGNVTLNLEGGTIENAFGGNNVNGNITGTITVNVIDFNEDCPLNLTNVYGASNLASYSPTGNITSPIVNVMHIAQADGIKGNVFGGALGASATVTANPQVNFGYDNSMSGNLPADLPEGLSTANFRAFVKGNVFGGGDMASVVGGTTVNVYKGEIRHKLVCGGNGDDTENIAANVSGNTVLNIMGGNLCTSRDANVGIYGGCHTKGAVGGDVTVTITGTSASQTTIGIADSVLYRKSPVNVHGGGYGEHTSVAGDVTVTFGDDSNIQHDYPKLYGDIYGGSAFGDVNTNYNNTTTVNLYNGTLICLQETLPSPNTGIDTTYYYSGNAFGGGLGQKADDTHPAIAALVHGEVQVNVGWMVGEPSEHPDLRGQATLVDCNVYGCNNKNGSPQESVHVHVYQTAHTDGTGGTPNNTFHGDAYAILNVFGGGSEANYVATNNPYPYSKRTHVYVHGCDNTIKYLYGGGNAADAVGVETIVEGGRYDEIYGGGNGLVVPAGIGQGGIGILLLAGYVNFQYNGSNKHGYIQGGINVPDFNLPTAPAVYPDCGSLHVISYYFGDNEAEHIGDLVSTIECNTDPENPFYNKSYRYVYAGSRWAVVYGDIRLTVEGGNIRTLFAGSKGYRDKNIPADVRRFPTPEEISANPGRYSQKVIDTIASNPSLIGTGGNIELIIHGGTIGEVIGGCDELGNVDGKITVIIDDAGNTDCPLFVGDVFGGCNETSYAPIYNAYLPTNADALPTPLVTVLQGDIGGTTSFFYGEDPVSVTYEGNVFGGGDEGKVTCNPEVIIGNGAPNNRVNVLGSVYGGGNEGDVEGSPKVVVVPNTHTLTITPPANCTITVKDFQNNTVASGSAVAEGTTLQITATSTNSGYAFKAWSATGGAVKYSHRATTLFTMGEGNATLTATMVPTHSLAIGNPANGTIRVVDCQGHDVQNGDKIAEDAQLYIHATPAEGHVFDRWVVSGGTVNSAGKIFTMGHGDASINAVFVEQ